MKSKSPVIIAMANQKGGVGKTTLCVQLAFYLAAKKGKRVLLIDMDGQGNATTTIGNGDDPTVGHTTAANLFEKDCQAVAVAAGKEGIDLIGTPKNDTNLFDKEAMSLDDIDIPRKNIESVKSNYDYILIDCPPSLGRPLIAALTMATDVFCPVKVSGYAVDGMEGLVRTIFAVKRNYNAGLNLAGVIVNDMDRSKSHEKSLLALTEALGDKVLKNQVMHRVPIDNATSDAIPIWKAKNNHVAFKELEKTFEEAIKKIANR